MFLVVRHPPASVASGPPTGRHVQEKAEVAQCLVVGTFPRPSDRNVVEAALGPILQKTKDLGQDASIVAVLILQPKHITCYKSSDSCSRVSSHGWGGRRLAYRDSELESSGEQQQEPRLPRHQSKSVIDLVNCGMVTGLLEATVATVASTDGVLSGSSSARRLIQQCVG